MRGGGRSQDRTCLSLQFGQMQGDFAEMQGDAILQGRKALFVQ
jgi:hypothetical protein